MKEDGGGEQMDYSVSSWQLGRYCSATSLHVGAVVVAALDWLPAPEWEEPQEFPASAANFG